MSRWDAIVVGAGPGGALAAYEMARRGASVLVVDRQPLPRWKVCGACLSPGALAVLDSVGLGRVPDRLGAVPLRTLSLLSGRRRARVRLEGSVALSRAAFDQALIDEAVRAGARLAVSGRASLGGVDGQARAVAVAFADRVETHSAGVVLDATGLGAGLGAGLDETDPSAEGRRSSSPPPQHVEAASRVGVGATFADLDYDLPFGELRMVIGETGYVGLVRVEDGRLNVAAALDPDALRGSSPAAAVDRLLTAAGCPPLDTPPVLGWKGTPALTRRPVAPDPERVFRLGDAAGYVEPFTGEGMCWAMSSAHAVAPLADRGIARWDERLGLEWAAYRRTRIGRSQRLCRAVAWSLRRPRLTRATLAALAWAPSLAAPFVRSAARGPSTLTESTA